MSDGLRKYRVIQWATGGVGREMLTAVLDQLPELELAGVRVYDENKNGVDAGTLVDRDPVGIRATTNVQEILALDADCVLYAPQFTSIDDVCALLASGKNVATVSFCFHPARIDPAERDRLLAACRQGGTSLHGSGLNPGNLSGVLPLAISGMSRTIDKIMQQERADWSFWDSPGITFDGMKFGAPVDEVSATATEFLAFNDSLFTQQVWYLSDVFHADIDGVSVSVDAVPALADHRIFDHLLRAGTTAGQRWNWVGRHDGEPRVEIETLWTVGGEYPPHWPAPESGWTLTITGDPSMKTHFEPDLAGGLVATAMQVVNAVPAVCEAPPGFATSAELPLIRSSAGFRKNRAKDAREVG